MAGGGGRDVPLPLSSGWVPGGDWRDVEPPCGEHAPPQWRRAARGLLPDGVAGLLLRGGGLAEAHEGGPGAAGAEVERGLQRGFDVASAPGLMRVEEARSSRGALLPWWMSETRLRSAWSSAGRRRQRRALTILARSFSTVARSGGDAGECGSSTGGGAGGELRDGRRGRRRRLRAGRCRRASPRRPRSTPGGCRHSEGCCREVRLGGGARPPAPTLDHGERHSAVPSSTRGRSTPKRSVRPRLGSRAARSLRAAATSGRAWPGWGWR